MKQRKSWAFFVVPLFLHLLLIGCAVDKDLQKGEELVKAGDLDRAVISLQKAHEADPSDPHKKIRYTTIKLKAAQRHLSVGEQYMEKGNYREAIEEFNLSLSFDSTNQNAALLLAKVQNMSTSEEQTEKGLVLLKQGRKEEARKVFSLALSLNPGNERAYFNLSKLTSGKKIPLIEGGNYELSLSSKKPITLSFKNTDMGKVFATLSKLSGINFIFDQSVRPANISIDLVEMPFSQALDLIVSTNNLAKKIINEKTILIFPAEPKKIKQYQDLVIRTFYLSDINVEEAAKLVKSILQSKQIHINKDLNTLVIRDTPDVIKLAEKILYANDIPGAEILFEIEILEVKQGAMKDIGFYLSPQFTISAALGLSGTEIFSGNFMSSSGDPGYISYSQLRSVDKNNIYFSLPAAVLNLIKNESGTQILANPKIRVKSREKANIHVGARVPIRTNRRVDTDGVVTYDFQYTDVGIKLNVEPSFNLPDRITIALQLEVSGIGSNVGTADDPQYEINTRRSETNLQLKDGETVLIGGLIQDDDTGDVTKVPLLGDIPLLGHLFSRNYRSKTKTEILMSITPYVVRGIDIPAESVLKMWSGQEQLYSVKGPIFETETATMEMIEEEDEPEKLVKRPPGLVVIDAPKNVKKGEEFQVQIIIQNVEQLYAAPFAFAYDPKVLKCTNVQEGSFLKQDGKSTGFLTSIDQSKGVVNISLSRMGKVGGIDGRGMLAQLTFEATSVGSAKLSIEHPKFLDAELKFYPVGSRPTNVIVDPTP